MKKRIISVIAVLTMIFTFILVAAADTAIVDSMGFQGDGAELTLTQAVDAMLKDNPTVKQAELDVEQAQIGYENSMRIVRKLKYAFEKGGSENKLFIEKQGYELPEQADILQLTTEYNKANIEATYKATVEGLKASIEESYFSLLQGEQQKKIKEENLTVAKDLYEKTKKKFELGVIAKLDVLNSESNYITAQNELAATENAVKSTRMLLNSILGNDVMGQIKLKDELKYNEYDPGSIAAAVGKALSNRYEVKSLEYAYAVQKLNTQISKKKYSEISYNYKKQVLEEEKALQALKKGKKGIEIEVRNNYMDILQSKDDIMSGEKTVKLAQEALKISQATFHAGMVLVTDVQKAQLTLEQAELGFSKAVLNYNLAVLKFEDSIGIGRR